MFCCLDNSDILWSTAVRPILLVDACTAERYHPLLTTIQMRNEHSSCPRAAPKVTELYGALFAPRLNPYRMARMPDCSYHSIVFERSIDINLTSSSVSLTTFVHKHAVSAGARCRQGLAPTDERTSLIACDLL
jgi:hypothetical protein